ncbi:MAG: Uma2 family endonuclease [Verrucomicrobiota bacterium]
MAGRGRCRAQWKAMRFDITTPHPRSLSVEGRGKSAVAASCFGPASAALRSESEVAGVFFLGYSFHMVVQTHHRFSADDYHRMAETGVLGPDSRVELLGGRIIDMSPIGPFHGGVVGRLTRLFNKCSKDRWLVWPQNPLRLDNQSEPEPDVLLLKPSPDDYTNRHPQPGDVFLLIEVADASLDYDREEKLPAYGRAGIAEVWIVNLVNQCIEIYRDPHFTGYSSKSILRAGDQARPQAFPDAVVDVSELLKR